MRRVTILGATGSIGRSTEQVILANRERFHVAAVVGGHDAAALARVATSLGARFAALSDPAGAAELKEALAGSGIGCGAGERAVLDAVALDADIVVAGVSGVAGLKPTVASLKPGRAIALANKETLVCAGSHFMAEAKRLGVAVLPMDSEHNAVAQALGSRPISDVASVTLTASGGPFREWSAERIGGARVADAMRHPNYSMGAKITVDSASLMNKGLELIEAHHIFGVAADKLSAVVHPEQVIHGMVGFRDGSLIAGMARPDMRVPIADCLGLGERLVTGVTPPDLVALGRISFEAPDEARFPCFGLARDALRAGGRAAAILNAANEIAVAAFLDGSIRFGDLATVVGATLDRMERSRADAPDSVEEALEIDDMGRLWAREILAGRLGVAMKDRQRL